MAIRKSHGIGGLVALVLLIGCSIGASAIRANYNDHIATCTILGKDRGYDAQSSSSHYRIYTQQCGTLGNTDQWLVGKTDSADVQGRLQVGHTYRLRIVGWRFSPLSEFPNVVSVQGEVSK